MRSSMACARLPRSTNPPTRSRPASRRPGSTRRQRFATSGGTPDASASSTSAPPTTRANFLLHTERIWMPAELTSALEDETAESLSWQAKQDTAAQDYLLALPAYEHFRRQLSEGIVGAQ